MAIIGTISGSSFIGCPIVVPVTPGSAPSGATFHRVCLNVTVGGFTFGFSSPAEDAAINFDVSSALRAVTDRYEYSATNLNNYPSLSFVCEAWDEWMVDGQLSGKQYVFNSSLSGLFAGSLSDRERLAGTLSPTQFSRKPTSSPEIVFVGMTWLKGATGNSPSVRQVAITDQTAATSEYYPIVAPRDAYEIRFINSMGVHESVHVTCLPADETAIATTRYAISKPETVSDFSRGIAIKQNDRERWKMSTQPIDRQWQQWYLHEFLMAKLAWAKVDGLWLPVHILPEETVKGRDRQKAAPMTVEFTIEFDINGSPFA